MRELSPFPFKVELKNPRLRIAYSEIDHELRLWIYEHTVDKFKSANNNYKEFKDVIINHWCNMMFGPEHWDFEYLETQDGGIAEYWLCFKDESYCSLVALKWN